MVLSRGEDCTQYTAVSYTHLIRMEPHKDPDEFIKHLGAEAFEERIHKARNGFMFGLEVLEKMCIRDRFKGMASS